MSRHTKPLHKSQPAQEPALPYTRQTSFSATQTHIIDDRGERVCAQHQVLCNWGMTLKQSSAVHIQALVSADGILPGSSSKLQLLVINLSSVPGRQLVNSPAAQSLERWLQGKSVINQSGIFKSTIIVYER